ncbi:MAG: hypothetical protein HQL26_02840 [Candidatus Omnitrophica bacterium]|nr:hypothetical protein [Candidatus Omnitrophota bacterium]
MKKTGFLISFWVFVCAVAWGQAAPDHLKFSPEPEANQANKPAMESLMTKPAPAQDSNLGEDDADGETTALIQMEQNRRRQIKLLNMELEQLKLQLEREKTLKEMGELRKENRTMIQDPLKSGDPEMPEMKAVYIAHAKHDFEAIVTINGRNYSVKPGDCPYAGVCVRDITIDHVAIRLKDSANLTLNVDHLVN